jgi:hypothetical protein
MFSVRSLISAAGGSATRMIWTYVQYPTNRASISRTTPLSSFLRRRALSTTPPDGDTSGGSHSTTKELISSAIRAPISTDFHTSASATFSDGHSESSVKSTDRDVEIRSLKDTIKNNHNDLEDLLRKIEALAYEQQQELLKSSRDEPMLKSIENNLSDLRKREDRLAAEILELKAELRALKNPKVPADALVPARGI